jgi:PAS domain S-box-containing protein
MPVQYSSEPSSSNQRLVDRVFQSEGELARLCRAKNWSETALGPVESWPAGLRAVAGLVVAAPAPMIVLWGPDLVQIYNDGYREVMGKKHPAGLGQPTRECWPEVWDFNAPLYEGVAQRRESFTFSNQPLTLERHGHPEEGFFTLTYSPALDDAGEVGGVLVTVTETTADVTRAQAERARSESEERLRLALEAADLGAWDLDLTTDSASVRTLRHDQIFGYQDLQPNWGTQIAMRHMLEEDRPIAERAFARAPEAGALSFEVRVRWPDGSVHWISVLGRTYYDDEGRPLRIAGVVADVSDRNRMEALRQSEERFRLVTDALPQIIWMTDAQGRAELFNRQWSAYTGEAPETAVGEDVLFTRLHPGDAATIRAAFDKARQTGSSFSVEHRIRSASGEYRWFVSMVEPYRDATAGEVSRWIGMSIDIHDRKLAEAKLRQAAELNAFRVALDNALRPLADSVEVQKVAGRVLGQRLKASRVLYGEISTDGDHALVQGAYCDGVPRIDGRYRLDDFGPTLIAEFRAGRTMIANNVAEDPRLTAAEREAWASIDVAALAVVPLIKGGRVVAVLATHQNKPRVWADVEVAMMEETAERTWATVQRAQAEKALRESEAKYRTLFESMGQGFGVAQMLFNGEGNPVDFRWLETNPAFERHTGFAASETLTVLELIPDLEQHWVEIYGRVALTGEAAGFVEGSETLGRWFEVYAWRIGEPEQRRVAVLFTDITARRQAEQAIQLANARLIESDRRKDEFLAMLAHELRNPLAAIGNTVKLLERNESEAQPLSDESQRYLNILNRQTSVLRGLVDDLLDVSRITRGLVELKQERLDLNAVAERALESCQGLMDEKNHEVMVTLPRKPLYVMGDPVRLEQIAVNLLTNAAKYTDPGGRIILCLERCGDKAELHVSDTGIGMTPEVLDRIFELFGQAERGLARAEGGLGIGLTIVKSLVELHGGQIEANSEGPDKGAKFTVSLPMASAEYELPLSDRQEPKPPVPSKRVLLVEDSQDIAETMALLLQHAGHEVAVAHNGPTALGKAEEFRPQAILLDIGLPGMDGYEVARRLRQNPHTKHAALAALTGYGQAEDIKRANAAGFEQHFTKPVDIEALEDFIGGVGSASRD